MHDPEIGADRLAVVPLLALGSNADGSPITEPAILSIDRPGAGAFPARRVELGALGALAHYRPCSSTQPGCLGPVRFSMALLSDPETAVATLDAELIERPGGSSAAACLGPDSVMFFDGEDQIYAGTLAVPMTAGLYEHARRPQGGGGGPPRPGMDINGQHGQDRQCGEVQGRFEVHRYEVVDDVVESALISFEQQCVGAARVLRGCLRVARP